MREAIISKTILITTEAAVAICRVMRAARTVTTLTVVAFLCIRSR